MKQRVAIARAFAEEAIYLADRIIVLAGRPSRIKADLPVTLSRPRDFVGAGFIALRKQLAELIGAW